MRRGWDALNMNFAALFVNSEALAVYIGFQAKNGHLWIGRADAPFIPLLEFQARHR